MDRWRAAAALLALAACIASSAAAPTASNQTALDLYEGAAEGCYYNFQHYGEGDRIMTNEPCLNCTCHNRMLMCYLRVCPFTKAIGQDCTVEKRADQCCPIVTCPDVPVDLLTSTSTTSPAEYGATGLGKLDKYGCSINGKYFPEGSKVPPTPNKPCEHCYCIRNMTTCVMQECTLHVDGCTPIYHKDVCCPVRYSCDHPEDEVPLLDDMSTTVRPTPGFLLTTTTIAPVTQMTQDCVHEDQIFADGALIKTEKACEHCYCMKGDIVCVVQECGAPMENEGKNCTSLPPREGQCCPDTYICEGDELTSDMPTESTTESIIEKLTTLSPPRRAGVEGSGYRNEPDEAPYTELPTTEPEVEGSGEEPETSKPLGPDEIIPEPEDGEQYMYVSTKAPASKEHDQITEINVFPDLEEKTDKPQIYPTMSTAPPREEADISEEDILELHEHVSTTSVPESYERVTTELVEALNTVPDVIPEEELDKPIEYTPSATNATLGEESGSPIKESEKIKPSSPQKEQDMVISDHPETSIHEYTTPVSISSNEIEKEISTSADILNVTPEVVVEKDHTEADIIETTSATAMRESERPVSQESEEEKESSKPEQFTPSTTSYPLDENEKLTTEPDHAENTVAIAEEDTPHPHVHIPMTTIALPSVEEERTTVSSPEENIVTDKVIKEDVFEPHENVPTGAPTLEEIELTTSIPDNEINNIPSEIDNMTSSEPERTTLSEETKATESNIEMKSTTISETATRLPDSIITKGDQYTITTEPSFRKEDESGVSTEKPKEFMPSTDKSEFVDEGLIPTSDHGEKTSSDVPSTEEEFTTSVPEYVTTQSTLETSAATDKIPSKIPEPSEQYGEVTLTTEKTAEVTASFEEKIETTEEPSRIPGEGDCLLNGVTYRNNTVVPSTNNCHSGCRCASSIIKCDPIICSPPPDYMDNCQSIYDSPDSCCPTYVCDHPRETVPPQSDNQMSGTESPLPTPTIECRGDQCEISEPAKQPSELCSSGSCLFEDDHKPHIECGSEGCSELVQKPEPSQPSVEKAEECKDGKCKPESCTNGDCQSPQTDVQVSPVKPCEGKHCGTVDEVTHPSPSSPQLCENEEDCKSLELPMVQVPSTPCEEASCKKIGCGDDGCISDVPHESQPVQCQDEDGCKSQNIPVQDCTGDEPCRRKEISASDEKLPTKCKGSNCEHESETTKVQNVDILSTELPQPFEEVPEKIVTPSLVEKATESPESQTATEEKVEGIPVKDIMETDTYTTENQINVAITEVDKEKPSVEDIPKPTTETSIIINKSDEEQPTTIETTGKSTAIETDMTESAAIIEHETDKPAVLVEEGDKKPIDVEDKSSEKPSFVEISTEKPPLVDDEEKETPTIAKENETTEIPAAIEREGTELPTVTAEDTEKPTTIDEETKEKPTVEDEKDMNKPVGEDAKEKPTVEDENDMNKPVDEEAKDKPEVEDVNKPGDEDGKEKPTVEDEKDMNEQIDEEAKEKPTVEDVNKPDNEDAKEKPTVEDEKDMNKPVDEEAKEKPKIDDEKDINKPFDEEAKEKPTEEDVNKPDDEDATEKPTVEDEKDINKPVDEEAKEKPTVEDVNKPDDEDATEKPTIQDEKDINKPIDEETKEKPTIDDEKEIIKAVDEEAKEKPAIEDKKDMNKPDDEEAKEKPESVDEKDAKKPDIEGTKEPVIIEEEGTTKPNIFDGEITDKPAITEKEGTELPITADEKDRDKPTLVQEEGIKKPTDTDEQRTEKPAISDEGTDVPPMDSDEGKDKPALIDEKDTDTQKLPAGEGLTKEPVTEVTTDKLIERETTKMPAMISEDGEGKPSIIDEKPEEDRTAKPVGINDINEEGLTVGEVGATEEPIPTDEKDQVPTMIGQDGIKIPVGNEIEKGKPFIDNEVAEKPKVGEDIKKTPESVNQETTEPHILIDEERPEKPTDEENLEATTVTTEEGQVKPELVDDKISSQSPSISTEEGTEEPVIYEEKETEKPVIVGEDDKEKLGAEIEGTKKPVIIAEEYTEKPIIIDEEIKEKPTIIDEEGNIFEKEYTKRPIVTVEEEKTKPEEERTDKPTIIEEEGTEEPASVEKEDAMKPILVEREGTELPPIFGENTEKPSLIDEITHETPTKIDEEGIKVPTVSEEEGTTKPVSIEKGSTDQPGIDEEKYTKEPTFIEKDNTDVPITDKETQTNKPLFDDKGKVKPSIEDNIDESVSAVDNGTDKPLVVEEESKDKPAIIDEEIKEKPAVIEEQGTEKPEEEGSGTLMPEIHKDESEKESMVPEIIAQTTETTVSELEKTTKTPSYESQTTPTKDVEYAYSTELNTAEPIETGTLPHETVTSETPVIKVTETEDSDSKVPVILEHSATPEIITESIKESGLTTRTPLFATISGEAVTSTPEKELVTVSSKSDLGVQTTISTIDTSDMKEADGTIGQDEGMPSTKTPELHKPIDKTTETGQVSEKEEVFTDTSNLETPTTKVPGVDLIEPQEGIKPERPDLPITGETEDESTTKVYEQEKIKPIPESHVTEVASGTSEKGDISGTELPEIKDKDKLESESLGQPVTEPEKIIPQLPEEEDIKIDHSVMYTPDKEAITTETPAYSVTEPIRRFTEIEDSSITVQGDITENITGYPEKSTEYHVPSATEKIDESLDITTSSQQPLFTDMQSPKLPEGTTGVDKPSVAVEDDKEKPEFLESPATDIPISVVTETEDISKTSEKDSISYEDKTTSIPVISEGYTEKQETTTEIPQYHVSVSQEHSEPTAIYGSEQHATESQEASTKPGEKEDTQMITTDIPKTSFKEEEPETKAPEIMYTKPHAIDEGKPSVTEMQKQSTELPTTEDIRTETPGLYATSEVPQSLVTGHQESTEITEELTSKPELITTQSEETTKIIESHIPEQEGLQTDTPIRATTDSLESSTKATKPDITEQDIKITKVPEDAVTEKLTTLRETPAVTQEIPESDTKVPEFTTVKQIEEGIKSTEYGSSQAEFSDTTPYLIELEEHTHKIVEDTSTAAPSEEEHSYKPVEDISTSSPYAAEHTYKIEEYPSTLLPIDDKRTTVRPEAGQKPQILELTTKVTDEEIGTTTKKTEASSKPIKEPEDVPEKSSESVPVEGTTQPAVQDEDNKYTVDNREYTTSAPTQISEASTSPIVTDTEKSPISESSNVAVPTEKETSSSEKPSHSIVSHETTAPEDEFIASTTKPTTVRQDEEMLTPVSDDKLVKPEEIPTKTSEVPVSSTTTEVSKPSVSDTQPTDEIPAPEEEGHFPPSGTSGYGEPEPDYVEEDQAFGPGTCRYGGKVYVSAQQIPRDDPCDFCFCFRSDIICLQQSCPPPIHGCHEEPIQGFCCPRYECPVSMATTVNVTTTTTTTTTTLPPHFPTHSYKGAAQRRGCQIKGHTYKVGEVVRSSSGPCLHCTCGGDGQMKCDPKACTPEPMLRQMIAAAVSAKRRR